VGDNLFAEGPDGSQDAPWIDLSSKTEFVLFSDPDRKTVLRRPCRHSGGGRVAEEARGSFTR